MKKKKLHLSKLIIPFVILSVFAFTGMAIALQFYGNVELSATLITCFYGFCGGELWMLASVKKAKIYKDIDGDGIPDEIDDSYSKGVEDALQKINELLNSERDDK
jgi:hypothetical protein